MTVARVTINTALRMIGVLASGREPRLSDRTDALEALRGFYLSRIASGAFGRLCDVVPNGTAYTARGNERIYRRDGELLSVTLPTLVSDANIRDYGHERRGYYGTVITVDEVDGEVTVKVESAQPIGNATPPRDGSPVIISDEVGGMTAAWLYDGTTKQWERVDALDEDDNAPRSAADPLGLAACLALEVSANFGVEVPPQVVAQAKRYTQAMTHRYGMRRSEIVGIYN